MFFPSSSPDKSADPNTAVGCLKRKIGFRSRFSYQQVHQSKLGHDLVLVDVEPGVHEEVVHLHEGEDHVEDRVDSREDVPGAAAHRNLKEYYGICLEFTSKKWTNSNPVYIRVPRPKAMAPSLIC